MSGTSKADFVHPKVWTLDQTITSKLLADVVCTIECKGKRCTPMIVCGERATTRCFGDTAVHISKNGGKSGK